MKIGEVAERTGVPARMIRYYESQGLIEPGRGANGYREYAEEDVARVRRVRNHVSAGLPTRLIKAIFDMRLPTWQKSCTQELVNNLTQELADLDERIACLTLSRQTIADLLKNVSPESVA